MSITPSCPQRSLINLDSMIHNYIPSLIKRFILLASLALQFSLDKTLLWSSSTRLSSQHLPKKDTKGQDTYTQACSWIIPFITQNSKRALFPTLQSYCVRVLSLFCCPRGPYTPFCSLRPSGPTLPGSWWLCFLFSKKNVHRGKVVSIILRRTRSCA